MAGVRFGVGWHFWWLRRFFARRGQLHVVAQDNYEIQVYGAETVAPGNTMVELHSNFTLNGSRAAPGSRYAADGTFPTNHAEHETVEITHGINNWSEVGFLSLHQRERRDRLAVGRRPYSATGASAG